MRKRHITSCFLSLAVITVFGQGSIDTIVHTPYGNEVDATYVPVDANPSERHFLDSIRADSFPNAIFYPTYPDIPSYPDLSSTYRFNCHGYAWHMTKGDYSIEDFTDPVVMVYEYAELYFTNDPSFKECEVSEANIWWINDGAHSALATSSENHLKSKWDNGPLAYHHKNESPYSISSVSFYKLCFKRLTKYYSSYEFEDCCKLELLNSYINDEGNVDIEFEDWVELTGTFTVEEGAELFIHSVSGVD